jgi:hypothetical protein
MSVLWQYYPGIVVGTLVVIGYLFTKVPILLAAMRANLR